MLHDLSLCPKTFAPSKENEEFSGFETNKAENMFNPNYAPKYIM
jgi:hypothetical protein